MQELTYEIPFERLCRLGRSMGRRAFRGLWMLRWGLLLGYLAILLLFSIFSDELDVWLYGQGVPGGSLLVFFAITAIFLAAMLRLRTTQRQEIKARTNFGLTIRLTRNEEGIHIDTDEIAYLLKWRGINQMLIEPDGVVLSHGSLFFFVPDSAFADGAGRSAFIRDVYSHLGDEAKARSEYEIGPVLAQAENRAS